MRATPGVGIDPAGDLVAVLLCGPERALARRVPHALGQVLLQDLLTRRPRPLPHSRDHDRAEEELLGVSRLVVEARGAAADVRAWRRLPDVERPRRRDRPVLHEERGAEPAAQLLAAEPEVRPRDSGRIQREHGRLRDALQVPVSVTGLQAELHDPRLALLEGVERAPRHETSSSHAAMLGAVHGLVHRRCSPPSVALAAPLTLCRGAAGRRAQSSQARSSCYWPAAPMFRGSGRRSVPREVRCFGSPLCRLSSISRLRSIHVGQTSLLGGGLTTSVPSGFGRASKDSARREEQARGGPDRTSPPACVLRRVSGRRCPCLPG